MVAVAPLVISVDPTPGWVEAVVGSVGQGVLAGRCTVNEQ